MADALLPTGSNYSSGDYYQILVKSSTPSQSCQARPCVPPQCAAGRRNRSQTLDHVT